MSEKVYAIIDPKTQTVQYEVEGVTGSSCDDLTRALRANNEELEYQQTSEYCASEELPDYEENHYE